MDVAELFRILEIVARHPQIRIAEICRDLGVSPATVKRRLSDLRRLGVQVQYNRRNGRFAIHHWGDILRPEGITSGRWRQSLIASEAGLPPAPSTRDLDRACQEPGR